MIDDIYEYSEYDHAEIMQSVIPFIQSNVEFIPLLTLDIGRIHLQKYRFGGIGSCFYQECASHIDMIIKFWNDTTDCKCSKLYYYAGDRLPILTKLNDYGITTCTFYVGMK